MSRTLWVLPLFIFCSLTVFAKTNVKLEIIGVEEEARKNIEASLDAEALGQLQPVEISPSLNQSIPLIKKALEPFGYFKATIRTSLLQKHQQWIARIHVFPGEPVRVSGMDLKISGEGSRDAIFLDMIHHLPLSSGHIFSASKYNETKRKLLNTATAHGYIEATFTKKEIRIDLKTNQADIVLYFNTGIRYRFGRLFFNDNPYDERFLKRYASFAPREYYVEKKLDEFREALEGSNYFKRVTIDPQVDQKEGDEIPIKVFVEPLPARHYSLGVGYGTDTGPRGSLGFEWRRLTRDGQRFKTTLQVSPVNSNLRADYIIPGKKPATDRYVLSAVVQKENQKLGETLFQKLIASYATHIKGWQQTIALTLQRERFTLENQPTQTQLLLFPSISWGKLSQDDAVRTSRGYRIDATLLAVPNFFGNTPFLQGKLAIKTIYPILKQDRIITRGSLNYTYTSNLATVPLSFQFFAGGAQNIRGYSFNSIGPGAIAWTASIEYRRHIKGDWYAAAFYDAGNVGSALATNFRSGIGLGVVWQSPIGALELTAAQAQNLPGKPIAIQFSMGADL